MSLEKEIRRIVGYMLRSQGSGEVTAADMASVKSVIADNSAKLTSVANAAAGTTSVATNALSVATNAASIANAASVVGAVVASNHASLVSDVGRISVNASAISTRVDSVSQNLSQNSVVLSNLVSAVVANSADVTSLKNRVSANSTVLSDAISAIIANSADVTSLKNRVSANSALTSNLQSAILANSATLSNALSAIQANSAQVSVIASALSQQISALSVVVSNEISARNALSVIVSNLNSAHNGLSAGIGGTQMKVVGNTQTLSAATKISGLSITVAANGVYQLDGLIVHAMSVVSSFGFAISTSAATFVNAAYRWIGNLSVLSTGTGVSGITNTFTGIGYGNESAIGSFTYSALAGTALTNMQTELRGVVTISTTGGSLQLKAKGGSGNDLLIKQGSYIRAFKIG